ncbi:MAG: rRNA maturation RNase YbeY [Actinomycetota bacterium]
MSDSDLRVTIIDNQNTPVDAGRLEAVARRTALAQGATGELTVELVDEHSIAELNDRFMGKPGPTDVLAFPIDGLAGEAHAPGRPPVVIGEIVVCPEFAAGESDEPEGHLDLLVAHGVLHLLGFDHDTEQAAGRMRHAERAATGREGASAS